MTWKCNACGEENQDDILRCLCGAELPIAAHTQKPVPWKDVILTTAPTLAGYKIIKTIDIITSECVRGINFFDDISSSITDTFGGRDITRQNQLRKARTSCLDELREEAHQLGGNAVIAVDFNYSELSGKGKSMLFLVASGTAVVIEDENQLQQPSP